jgi:hypothetical protein
VLHLTPREYLAGNKSVKRNYSPLGPPQKSSLRTEKLRRIDAEFGPTLNFPKRESRAPKHGFWLMRGAQPATSAGARLFAGSPIPALFTAPQRAVKKSILVLLLLRLASLMSTFRMAGYFCEKYIAIRMSFPITFTRHTRDF